MKRIATVLLLLVSLNSFDAVAQTRTRRSSVSTRRSTAATTASQAEHAGAQRVADQIKVLTKFIYILGGVAKGIENVDDAARRNEASPAIVEQTAKSKTSVRSSIKSVREGLDKLEIDFRTTPELQRYYIKLAGVAAGAATAEDFAAANQFDKAGRTLLEVVNRLTDVLLEMQ